MEMKHYKIEYSCFCVPTAIALDHFGYNQAIADKQEQPSLIFKAAEWYGTRGNRIAALSWKNGRWA